MALQPAAALESVAPLRQHIMPKQGVISGDWGETPGALQPPSRHRSGKLPANTLHTRKADHHAEPIHRL